MPSTVSDPAIIASVEAALAALDADALVARTRRLVEVPSLSGDESAAQQLAAEEMAAAGMRVDTWHADLDALQRHPGFSAEFERPEIVGAVGRSGAGSGGRTLLLTTHVDVVPVGDPAGWTTGPFTPEVREGRLYGRGACDAKGGLAAAITAVDAIRRAGIELAGEVLIAPVVGEEDGGCGTLAALQHGVTADACVVLEPTDLSVVRAVAGALSFRITLTGRTAHGAMRHEGVSAIERLPLVLDALRALEADRNRSWLDDEAFGWLPVPFAICAGRLRAGDWPSNEAAWLELEGRYGVAPDEDLTAAKAALEDAVVAATSGDGWLAAHPPTVEWWGAQFLPGSTPADQAPVPALSAAVQRHLGVTAPPRGMPYGCDMGLWTSVGGIPTAVFGPGDIRVAHGLDEHVPVDELVQCARVLVDVIVSTCGVSRCPR